MSKVIAIDCDEVLADSMRSLLDHSNNFCCDVSIERDQISNYHIHDMDNVPLTAKQTNDRFNAFMNHAHDSIVPVAGAHDVLMSMKKSGYTMIVVTARDENQIGDVTRSWLADHFDGLFDDVIFTNHFGDGKICKGDVCKKIAADVFIDDNIYHAKAVAQHGIQTYLLDKPRNQEYCPVQHTGITKVSHWSEVIIS